MMNMPNTIIKLGKIDDSGFVAYKLIPNDINSEVILAQFWINERTALVEKTTFVLKELETILPLSNMVLRTMNSQRKWK